MVKVILKGLGADNRSFEIGSFNASVVMKSEGGIIVTMSDKILSEEFNRSWDEQKERIKNNEKRWIAWQLDRIADKLKKELNDEADKLRGLVDD